MPDKCEEVQSSRQEQKLAYHVRCVKLEMRSWPRIATYLGFERTPEVHEWFRKFKPLNDDAEGEWRVNAEDINQAWHLAGTVKKS